MQEVSFDNCACIFDRITNITSKFAMSNGTAVNGICEQSCNKLGIFLVVVFLVLILLFMLQVPNVVITVRQEY